MADLGMSSDDYDFYENVFCNPAFEPENDHDETKEAFKVVISSEPIKRPAQINGDSTKGVLSPLDSWSGGMIPHSLTPSPTVLQPVRSSLSPQPEQATTYTKCGGVLTDPEGSISSPNHPGPYPPDSMCVWVIRVSPPSLVQLHISSLAVEGPVPCLFDWLEVREEKEQTTTVSRMWRPKDWTKWLTVQSKSPKAISSPAEQGQVIKLRFHNFSLETQDVCEFDYVEVHDSANAGDGNVLGRFCGSSLPGDLTSTGPAMTVVFVADEGVADSGFYASYQVISLSEISSCEPIQVEMCQGLRYNLTSFPNIWLSIADQREAENMLRQYRKCVPVSHNTD
ncbi:hypothetical protein NFI96_001298 [Prochilodus magdalenae]|nr:hypothetical protein NFI96_001298 [Prochilodus magdalenae]